jgi:hypothetical protein
MSDLALIKKHMSVLPKLAKEDREKIAAKCKEALARCKSETSREIWQKAINACAGVSS